MSSYFSNHSSNSRFLSISNSNTPLAAVAPPPSSTATTTTAPIPPKSSASQSAGRARSTSKHFSTSVEAHSEARKAVDEEADVVLASVHPLRNTWVFWFQQRTPGNKLISYEEGIKRVASFSSVESFWSLHTHLTPPSHLLPTTDYLLFHSGIARPVWEDPLNITGGKYIVRLRKGVADRIWEALVCAVVGDMFAACRDGEGRPARESWEDEDAEDGADADVEGEGEELPEICGCTISVRQSEDIISLWNRVEHDARVKERIKETLRQVLNLPTSTIMEYKSNSDSMQDNSSFRNSAVDPTPGAAA
ncbi:translation initiation factor eIF 4e-like domain-containing protein [Favolaschia claudopus]|uniref:Translation initiation factor eIF 4e-like domain-containing protein n=1 Tax=Favolaschia claudopus TaxID=2862362 RepID=A0AAV9Z4W2_9AGAR